MSEREQAKGASPLFEFMLDELAETKIAGGYRLGLLDVSKLAEAMAREPGHDDAWYEAISELAERVQVLLTRKRATETVLQKQVQH